MILEENKIIDAQELREIIPYSKMQIYRLEKEGKFPKRIKLGLRRIGWSFAEILQWIEERKAGRNKWS